MSSLPLDHSLTRFEAPDADFARRVRESFDRQRAMALIGAVLESVEAGACAIRLPFREDLTQQHGFVHGGLIGTIADSAAGYAGMSIAPADAGVLTVEYKLNLMSPARGAAFLARGRVVRPGRTLVIAQADVAAVDEDGRERHCATLLQTLMIVTGREERP